MADNVLTAERPVHAVPLEEKVGQLFVAGFDGVEPTDDIEQLVSSHHLGGIIYFSRNIESPSQVASLSERLQTIAREAGEPPLLIATDQEGGVVSRFDWGAQLPSQMALGATQDPTRLRSAGETVGEELASLGISMNFAPVLDVNNNPENPVIGVRSFGDDPEAVGELGSALASGFQSAGVIACGKHFPGHGDTETDSHRSLPVIPHDKDRLEAVEFVPFRRAIDDGIDALMTTHIAFPAITGDDTLPATLSKEVLTGLLREEFEFDGLLVSDCLEMNAIAETVGTAEGAVQAIAAGCDVVLVSHSPERQREAIERVIDAVESGEIPEARVDSAFERVREYKHRQFTEEREKPQTWTETVEQSREVARQLAREGATVVRDRDDTLPFDTSAPIHLVGFTGDAQSDAEDDRYDPNDFRTSLARNETKVYHHEVTDTHGYEHPFDGGEQVVVATYHARSNPGQARVVREIADAATRLAVVSVRDPYDLAAVPDASTYVTGYGYSPAMLDALADVVVGKAGGDGTLPVTIPGVE
ncbi:beta-N-acetylhexosaminidase (plasmid) [Haloferax mediterranei ATCC 33500]|uniref:Beta-D-glucosidase n=1 Tax=Haloferax mediterranei (strain ATCC 33500 / DSM 1411 / JCM 8866 / NBRC 14739 / NCIMB 2177 / R-4) TaxID=523841 RepID=I3R9F6_HALMT|nr:beta-N-acetylhexosaminidase [Haloferax mediterranei]AFK20866.1 beta-D-glucosidase [Haloferax mediterranei ATCC 33500]AHZ24265.1 glycoside hydrolase [Haloferax mediterranei ATCC 33500]EMA05344.1 beta-D-glucosidase [Haloferax mediterranei ATCC 33500]MDX5989853.1 beta-N-acetylhexosaminidase [Haloferax mediterranei ATCC 33500]QCQ77294.1 beta-N-acetylhexosaminidase [Haloferax mediterranei ATCC 33500]